MADPFHNYVSDSTDHYDHHADFLSETLIMIVVIL